MEGNLGAPCVVRSLVVVVALLLAGCQSLVGKMERDLKVAADLNHKCDVIENAFSLPSGELTEHLALRLRLKFTGSVCKPEASENSDPECPAGGAERFDFQPISSELKRLHNRIERGINYKSFSDELATIKQSEEKIRKSLATIKQSEEEIRKSIREIVNDIDVALDSGELDDIKGSCKKSIRLECGAKIAGVMGAFANKLREKHKYQALAKHLKDIRLEAERIVAALDAIVQEDKLSVSDDVRAAIVQLKELVSRADRIFEEGIRVTGLVLAADGEVVFDELFVHRMKYRAADRFITMSENQIARFDKLVDKADETLLMAGSFGLWFWDEDIQDVFDKTVVLLGKEALDKLDFALAFGRAGCDHLAKTPPPPTMFAPFLNRAIIKMVAESLCVGKKEEEKKKACQNSIFKTVAKDEDRTKDAGSPEKRAVNSSKGQSEFAQVITNGQKEDAARAVKVDSMGRYGACYASLIAAQSELIVAAPESAMGRMTASELAARTCGSLVEATEAAEADGKADMTQASDQPGALLQALRAHAIYATSSYSISNQYVATTINNITTQNNFDTHRNEKPPPMLPCDLLEQRIPGTRCRKMEQTVIEIAIPGLYAEGEFQSEKAYATMVQLADAVRSLGVEFAAEIGGTTSSSRLSCAGIVGKVEKARMLKRGVPNIHNPMRVDPVGAAGVYKLRVPQLAGQSMIDVACSHDGEANRFLAVLRAATAADLLARQKPPIASIKVLTEDVGSPAPFVATQDRGLVVKLTRKQ